MGSRSLLLLVSIALVPALAQAHGHRADAAGTYSKVYSSELDGYGVSGSVPLCWIKIGVLGDCEKNDFSVVAAASWLDGFENQGTAQTPARMKVRALLAGVRYTWKEIDRWNFVPFAHVLAGRVRSTLDSASESSFGLAGTVGGEVVLTKQLRLRGQYGLLRYRAAGDTKWGHGFAFALAVGTEVKHP